MLKDVPTTNVTEGFVDEGQVMSIRHDIQHRFHSRLRVKVDIQTNVSPAVRAASNV